jgi:hypothetical protein
VLAALQTEGDKSMGLFKDAENRAPDAMGAAQAGAQIPGLPGGIPDMASMSMPDPAYVQLVNKIGKSGVEAPGELRAIRAVGSPDFSGATLHEFDVTIRPAGGEPYETTIKQSMLVTKMQGLAEGQAITVKYDPDSPTVALLHSW